MKVMETLFAIVFALSLSGSLTILLLLGCGRLLKGRLGWGWLYYLWLAAVFRLLLPFSFGDSLLALVQETPEIPLGLAEGIIQPVTSLEKPSLQEGNLPVDLLPLWSIWAAGAVISLGKKTWDYRMFLRRLRKGWIPVPDRAAAGHTHLLRAQGGFPGKIRLYICPGLSTPILVGLFRPCIVLPTLDLPESGLHFTLLHELTHCRRRDALYKRLVQFCVCLHWFNPLVYWMERETNRLCELSCDELILKKLSPGERVAYGDTLVNSLMYSGGISTPPSSPALKRDSDLTQLKERLGAIMKNKRKTRVTVILSAAIVCAVTGAASLTGVQAKELLANSVGTESPSAISEPATDAVPSEAPSLEENSSNAQPAYLWPVGNTGGYVSMEYNFLYHDGMDVAAPKGTPVYAVADGMVETAETDAKYGKYVVVRHSDNLETRYYHCNELSVIAGQEVRQGDKIAEVGQTGMATGAHLHIGFYLDGEPQNPADYIHTAE